MYKLIGENNKVNYGSIDEPIDFNYKDFKLLNFFGKEIRGLKKKFAFHKFNYIGIITDDYLVGFAAVSLSYMHNVFAYLFDYKKGLLFEYNTIGLGDEKKLLFPVNPDEYEIRFKKGKTKLHVSKSHSQGMINIDADFEGKLKVESSIPYNLENNQPLRVLNPSEPSRWTFTEKCSPLTPESIEVSYEGMELKYKKVSILYDWSGGYLRRNTNWYWAAFSGILPGDTKIGANIAALVNESCFNENAFWINGKRTRSYQCIFDFDVSDPYKPWHIWNEAGTIDLRFVPEGERAENINALFIKTAFRQFVGRFSGILKPENGTPVEFGDVYGFTEYHRAKW